MAQDTSLSGLRQQQITSMFGRRLGLAPGNLIQSTIDFLVGARDIRVAVEGVGVGTTIVSTAVATPLPPYGVSLLGATAASATTAYTLSAPVPGVRKVLFVPTTGYAVVVTTTDTTGAGAGPMLVSTASVTSTYQTITFTGKGNFIELIGLTTALWGVLTNYAITSVTTGNTVSFT